MGFKAENLLCFQEEEFIVGRLNLVLLFITFWFTVKIYLEHTPQAMSEDELPKMIKQTLLFHTKIFQNTSTQSYLKLNMIDNNYFIIVKKIC